RRRMEGLLWLSVTTTIVYALLVSTGLVIRLGRPQDPEYGPSAAMSAFGFVFALSRMMRLDWPNASGPLMIVEGIASIGIFVAGAHYVVAYTKPKRAKTWLLVSNLVGAACSGAALFGQVRFAHDGDAHPVRVFLRLFGRPETTFGWILYSLAAIATAIFILASLRRFVEGDKPALGITIGASLFFAAILSDATIAAGLWSGPWLMQLGLLAMFFGMGSTSMAKYAAVANQLEKSTIELEKRTKQLRQSYQDLHEAQEELVRKEQLAVVGELAAVVAHEVRNPLAVIANAVAGLRKPSISREDQTTLLGILEDESSRLNRLVSDLLRYARPVNVQRSHVLLGDVLDRALRFARENEQVTIQSKIETDDHAVWGDASLLRQVFDNLVDNAVQAMPLGGSLSVVIRASKDEGVEGVSVLVSDTGEGMDTTVKARARDPFFTTRPSGTGLGLAIVDRIVEAHSGHLLISSHAGEGTTVTVFLPIGRPSDVPQLRAEPKERKSPLHLLQAEQDKRESAKKEAS
ncbi:MAG TPA: ATP-binding protein, partial [Polyangiaceae bacterium]